MPPTTDITRQMLDQAMEVLRQNKQRTQPGDSMVTWDEESKQIQLPGLPSKMAPRPAATELIRMAEAQEAYNVFDRMYHYRPGDGAVATHKVLMDIFGRAVGKTTMFTRPEMRTVEVALGVQRQVPWGQMELPITFGEDAILYISEATDDNYGTVLFLRVKALKAVEDEVSQLFDMIGRELELNSIYRSQAITALAVPSFMDLTRVSEHNVVYAHHTARRLNYKLWSAVRLETALNSHDSAGKKIIWLHGDYGTGKSETALLLAKLCVEYGWTFIFIPAGVGSWDYAVQMLRLYGPRVALFAEDAETMVRPNDPLAMSKMLDQLDGVEAKAMANTLIVFTTNHMDRVNKGQTRPGRAFDLIRLGNLDRAGTEQLAYVELGQTLADDVDFDAVYAAMGGTEGGEAGLTPAFMRQAYNTAKLVAIVDGGGTPGPITTDAILDGVRDLQEQLDIHLQGPEPDQPPKLESVLREVLRPMVDDAISNVTDSEGFSQLIYDQARNGADSVVEERIHQSRIVRERDGETWARISTN